MLDAVYYALVFFTVMSAMAVAVNPSPFFGALGLVSLSLMGCCLLVGSGCGFFSLVLFLIYLGGMLVVFAYTSALASDIYPETWTSPMVMMKFMVYMGLLGGGLLSTGVSLFASHMMKPAGSWGFVREDVGGVSLAYAGGELLVLVAGVALLVTLFCALEMVRGLTRGGLRVP